MCSFKTIPGFTLIEMLVAIAVLLVVFRPADDPERRGRPPLRVEAVPVALDEAARAGKIKEGDTIESFEVREVARV